VPPICLPLVCEPREAKLHPTSVYHLKFSLPYSVAMLAVHGSVGVDDYTEEMLADPDVHAFAARVFCHADDSMAPDHFPARVEITAAGSRRFVQDIPAQPGDPDNPMRPDDHRRKFRANVAPTLGEEQTDELLGTLEAAWDAPEVRTLAGLTVPAERGHR
jgi:2-methylcitrate dehydratase PrpD